MRADRPQRRLSARWLAALLMAGAVHADGASPLAPGYGDLPYDVPKAGSYALPVLGAAADGAVVDGSGADARLHALYAGKIVLLSFIYATCDDINGCPLATAVLQKLGKRLIATPGLAAKTRLLTLSFNPAHDTPQVMRRYGETFRIQGLDWRFLTTRSDVELRPILQRYGQSAEAEYDANGRPTGKYAHLLRVFLIDQQRRIRNIYTASVLHPDLMLADIQTLNLEAKPKSDRERERPKAASASAPSRAGDDKSGYEAADYRTHSAALTDRIGKPADLYELSRQTPLGLPKLPIPSDNPLSRDKIALGRKLFYDRRLSLNDTISCAMCHIPEQGFASQEQATAIGIEGRTVRRNAPTVYNVAYYRKLFHDGRESSLENQVWGPLLAPNEMGNPSIGFVLDKLGRLPDYRGLFEMAFHRGPSMETLGQAIASYERTLNSADSPFDRWYYGKQKDALTTTAHRGFRLFTGKAGCSQCHSIDTRAALFTDNALHNTGIGFRDSMGKTPLKQRVQIAPGIAIDLDAATLSEVGEPKPNDLGAYEITRNPVDRWAYRTPSLRNIALTAPYMHNGALRTLNEVVDFYDRGGEPNENLDPQIKPLQLSAQEKADLVEFLKALTGGNVDTLVSDAQAAPIGDPD